MISLTGKFGSFGDTLYISMYIKTRIEMKSLDKMRHELTVVEILSQSERNADAPAPKILPAVLKCTSSAV